MATSRAALLAFVLLGVRDTKRVDSLNPETTFTCDGFFPDIRHSTELKPPHRRPGQTGLTDLRPAIRVQECALAARDQFSTLAVESIAIGFGMALVLAGLARSGAGRRNDSSGTSPPLADQLDKLVKLHGSGDLSDEEFAAAKRSLLS